MVYTCSVSLYAFRRNYSEGFEEFITGCQLLPQTANFVSTFPVTNSGKAIAGPPPRAPVRGPQGGARRSKPSAAAPTPLSTANRTSLALVPCPRRALRARGGNPVKALPCRQEGLQGGRPCPACRRLSLRAQPHQAPFPLRCCPFSPFNLNVTVQRPRRAPPLPTNTGISHHSPS